MDLEKVFAVVMVAKGLPSTEVAGRIYREVFQVEKEHRDKAAQSETGDS